ncbi:MAG TPA: 16S rRNA (guanine(966)-N(2))-methyltransferase RsmD [Terriglobia bacterium]|nr:16S rRNA (guanine(966)-N(2))-methyltransferase RsmD [Terriglobia bacterium]
MRVIAGAYGGLRLKTLKGAALRPTSDQLRETLFNILGEGLEGAQFLDAYAGSGAVGIEALSRGAQCVVFLEHHRPAVELIRQNLTALGVDSGFEILTCPVMTGIERLESQSEKFDFVFLDPPYAEIREYHRVLRKFGRSEILLPQSLVIAEHSRHCNLEERYGSLALARRLRHGDSQLAFYRRGIAGGSATFVS